MTTSSMLDRSARWADGVEPLMMKGAFSESAGSAEEVADAWLAGCDRQARLVVHPVRDIGASLASGSFAHDGMVVVPCSTATAGSGSPSVGQSAGASSGSGAQAAITGGRDAPVAEGGDGDPAVTARRATAAAHEARAQARRAGLVADRADTVPQPTQRGAVGVAGARTERRQVRLDVIAHERCTCRVQQLGA